MKLENAIKSKFTNNNQKLLVNLMFTGNYFQDFIKTQLKPYDLLPQHYNTLRIVKGKHPEPVNPGYIKQVLLDKANDVTRLLDKMVEKGLITRETSPENRRKININITEKGIDTLAEIQLLMDKINTRVELFLNEDEVNLLNDLIDKVRDVTEEY